MKILSLEYQDCVYNWKVEKTSFENLTLLVGASGVGKTQILRAIKRLGYIASGSNYSSLKWSISFEVLNGDRYIWNGEFEDTGVDVSELRRFFLSQPENSSRIIRESLSRNGVELVFRENDAIYLEKKATPRLSRQESCINLFSEEPVISPVYKAFKKIIDSDQSESNIGYRTGLIFPADDDGEYNDIEKIRNSDVTILYKLYLAYKYASPIFQTITSQLSDVFPIISSLKFDTPDINNISLRSSLIRDAQFLHLKETDVDHWIIQSKFSSGVYRTLMHLAELHLAPEGSVILIDEFENSLGINCIDAITDQIVSSDRGIQFIITSHHPYIINNIDYKYWKLVTRNGGLVKTHNAAKFGLGNSKHEAFKQLMQLSEFRTGMYSE